MRGAFWRLSVSFIVSLTSLAASASQSTPFGSTTDILKWMNDYRKHPQPLRAPIAVHDLSNFGALRDPESAGFYLGFVAGVLAANPHGDATLATKMLPLPAEDQWLVVRAIAYSGVLHWRATLAGIRPRVPARDAMVQRYLQGTLPVIVQYRMDDPKPGWFSRLTQTFSFGNSSKKPVVLRPTPDLLDFFWGYYYATGDRAALQHIVELLAWSTNKNEVDKLTLGGMAKYTLTSNGSRDPVLLTTIKSMQPSETKAVQPVLKDVIEAAEDADVSRVHKEMLASLEKLKRNGPQAKRDVTFWGQVGEGALAAGCIALAVAGQVQFGIPCVVGGAVSSGGLQLWSSQN